VWEKYRERIVKVGVVVAVFWLGTILMTTYFDHTKNTFNTALSITLAHLMRWASITPLCTWLDTDSSSIQLTLLSLQLLIFTLNIADSFSLTSRMLNEEIIVLSIVIHSQVQLSWYYHKVCTRILDSAHRICKNFCVRVFEEDHFDG